MDIPLSLGTFSNPLLSDNPSTLQSQLSKLAKHQQQAVEGRDSSSRRRYRNKLYRAGQRRNKLPEGKLSMILPPSGAERVIQKANIEL